MTTDREDPPRDPPKDPPPLPFNSPERARLLSGEPTWGRSGETYAVIPDLGFRPAEGASQGCWQIRAWGANGVMFRTEVRESSIIEILQCWRDDPEGTWEKLFGRKPPGIAGKVGGEGVKVRVRVSSLSPRVFTDEELDDLDF